MADKDTDGIDDSTDNCFQPNPDQKDFDADGIGYICDNEDNTITEPEQPMLTGESDNTESTETEDQGNRKPQTKMIVM